MKIVLHAYDVAPSKNLSLIAAEAMQRGHHVRFTGGGTLDDATKTVDADIIVTGLSAPRSEGELALGAVAEVRGIPWIVLADTHQSWARTAAFGKVKYARLLIASPLEIDAALAYGYGRVEYCGGPPMWREYREKGASPFVRVNGTTYVLVAGVKSAEDSNEMLSGVIATMNNREQPWMILFTPHPREVNDTVDSGKRERLLSISEYLSTSCRTSQLVPHVDLAVMALGASDTIAAAYHRVPVILYENEHIGAFFRTATGLTTWFPVDVGVCARATPVTIESVIKTLLSDAGRDALRKRQEEVYPSRTELNSTVEERILNRLEELAAKK